ncbi:MAG: 2-oxoacid:acceptor oxidoreductase subunit alpha [Desulfovibrio sp.]|nr:MAG: 2-oxoacid:acceptor oxidoreductase subunit alpha [Desulfovibrio sp.]
MSDASVNICIGGEAGQGLATVGQMLAKSLVRGGYEITVHQDYMSRIRGGHNTFSIRTSTESVTAPIERIDILVALAQETVVLHAGDLADNGLVIIDSELDAGDYPHIKVPFKEIAPKAIFTNIAALGILAALLGLDRDIPAKLINDTFGKKGQEIVDQNVEVLDKAMAWVNESGADFPDLPPAKGGEGRLMLSGNEAIALGALAAGVKFCSFYPMTPSTSVALNLISYGAKMGVVVEQAEDEIAAVNMGLGASFAGARTIVPTSGGGFALMTEGVSLAGIIEQPIVFALVMRPGPATGLPTRSEQADLNLALYAGHGEFPRAIYAPGTVGQCFDLTHKAFDVAEKYQSPVFVLSDQFQADSFRAVEPFHLDALPEPVLPLMEMDDAEAAKYERYAITDSGVSPRAVPGMSRALVVADSDEHTPDGHITEDKMVRVAQQDKRMRKGQGLLSEVIPPEYVGDETPDLLLVCWGSTRGAVLEAAQELRDTGTSAAVMHFSQVYPLNAQDLLPKLEAANKVACVESNATGQFADLLQRETGYKVAQKVLRYDGWPFTAASILEQLGA